MDYKKAVVATLMLCLSLSLVSCNHKSAEKPKDPNKGKHQLVDSDVRGWHTYPLLVLISAKHRVGIDTVAQLIKGFDEHFDGDGVDYEPVLPTASNVYQEDTPSAASDAAFLASQARHYNLAPSAIATIINDFYVSGGSNRDFPERSE